MRTDQRPRGRYNGNRQFLPQTQGPQRNQTLDSNGPGIKIRGSAQQIFERYVALAREAAIGGDPVAVENLYQHAEHYFRIANANRDGNQPASAPPQATMPAAASAVSSDRQPSDTDPDPEHSQPGWGDDRPGFI